MFSRPLSIIRRPLSDRLKGLSSWAASAFWWIADKAFGDTVFGWLKAVVGAAEAPQWAQWAWSYGPPLLLFLLGLYFFNRPEKRLKAGEGPTAAPAPQVARTRRAAAPAEASSATAVTSPRPAPPEPDWGKLYELADNGERVRLRFLPDTEDQQDDAVLLLVLGHKVTKGEGRAFVGAVHFEAKRAMHHAPNSRVPPPLRDMSFMRSVVRQADLGRKHVDAGLLRRVGLSRGGFYGLTERGEEDARAIAGDLIRRA